MQLQVACPSCHVVLRIQSVLAGSAIRCPKCKTAFRVPAEERPLDDEISNWIEEDLDEMDQEQDSEWIKRLQDEANAKKEAQQKRDEQSRQAIKHITAARPKTKPASASEAAASDHAQIGEAPIELADPLDGSDGSAHPDQTIDRDHDDDADDIEFNPYLTQSANDGHEETRYSQDVLLKGPVPRIVVMEMRQRGATLAFDSTLISNRGFRLSFPEQCAFSGERDPAKLLAKPLVFTNRSEMETPDASVLESGHDVRLADASSGRELLQSMGELERMHKPYATITPYYVREDLHHLSLECRVESNAADKRETCIVFVQCLPAAVAWLRNVNGVCGVDYRRFRRDAAELWTPHWRGVDEQTRMRLGEWCEFEVGERFRFYVRDAEFNSSNSGHAGIVLTDRRLIYRRYHTHGSVPFDDRTTVLRLKPDNEFVALSVRTLDGTVKASRLRPKDVDLLSEQLEQTGLKFETSKSS